MLEAMQLVSCTSAANMNCQVPLCCTTRELYSGLVDASKLDDICDQCLSDIQNTTIPDGVTSLAANVVRVWAGLQSLRWCEGLNRHQQLNSLFSVQILSSRSTNRWCKQLGAIPSNCEDASLVDPIQFNELMVQNLRCTLFGVLCKNFLMHAWKNAEHASNLSVACCANTNIGPPLLGAGNSPESCIIQYTTQELTSALRALDIAHQHLALDKETVLYLESLCLRTAVQIAIEEDANEWSVNVIAPADSFDADFSVVDAERIWFGVIFDMSAFSTFAKGRLVSPTILQTLDAQDAHGDKSPLEYDQADVDDAWKNICANLQNDIFQASAQAPAQRPLIAVRQEICIGAMLPYGYSAGVMRALTSLERQGRDKAAQLFQTMTYRKPNKLWNATDGLEQSVALAVIRAALVFQHGNDAGIWFDQNVPWRTLDGTCVLNRFGHKLRRTALAYAVDACYASLHTIGLEGIPLPMSLVNVLLYTR